MRYTTYETMMWKQLQINEGQIEKLTKFMENTPNLFHKFWFEFFENYTKSGGVELWDPIQFYFRVYAIRLGGLYPDIDIDEENIFRSWPLSPHDMGQSILAAAHKVQAAEKEYIAAKKGSFKIDDGVRNNNNEEDTVFDGGDLYKNPKYQFKDKEVNKESLDFNKKVKKSPKKIKAEKADREHSRKVIAKKQEKKERKKPRTDLGENSGFYGASVKEADEIEDLRPLCKDEQELNDFISKYHAYERDRRSLLRSGEKAPRQMTMQEYLNVYRNKVANGSYNKDVDIYYQLLKLDALKEQAEIESRENEISNEIIDISNDYADTEEDEEEMAIEAINRQREKDEATKQKLIKLECKSVLDGIIIRVVDRFTAVELEQPEIIEAEAIPVAEVVQSVVEEEEDFGSMIARLRAIRQMLEKIY